jgi:uncharacterized protein (TIGR04255 family)
VAAETQADVPFGDLPSRERVRLTDARIEAAVAEVRFVGRNGDINTEAATEALARFTPFGALNMEVAEQREVAFVVGPSGSAKSDVDTTARGWQFLSPDRRRVFTLLPTVASVQVLSYERWSESLRPLLSALLDVIGDVCDAHLVQRIGLRYINRLPAPPQQRGWLAVVDPGVAGVLAHAVLGPVVRSAHQQFELELEKGVGAVVRHGPLAGPAAPEGYLIDIDVFDSVASPFDTSAVLARAHRLNRTAFSLFTQLLTQEQIERMGPVQLEATKGIL